MNPWRLLSPSLSSIPNGGEGFTVPAHLRIPAAGFARAVFKEEKIAGERDHKLFGFSKNRGPQLPALHQAMDSKK